MFRYLQLLQLNNTKKRIVAEWKAAQVKTKTKQNEDALVSEVLSTNEQIDDIHMAQEVELKNENAARMAEEERLAAKARVAKWRTERMKILEQQKVYYFAIIAWIF